MKTRQQELGDLLIREGVITSEQLKEALGEQVQTRERLGAILCRKGYIQEEDLLRALAHQLGLRLFDPSRDGIESKALELVPVEFSIRHDLLPIRMTADVLTVAMSDPLDVVGLDHLRSLAKLNLDILVAPSEKLEELRRHHYGRVEGTRSVEQAVAQAVVELGEAETEEELDEDEAKRRAQDAPIVKLVEQMIVQALNERATDIHVEPGEYDLIIRYRVDGLLYVALKPPQQVYMGLSSRVKILANMDIAERRAAQDGRFTVRSNGREVDVRVSSVPTIHGEKLVLRLLDKGGFNFALTDLGFSQSDYEAFLESIRKPHGMVLLSGPTGSGKTTTLYASILELWDESRNFMTVEDPVEYHISSVNQVQVNPRKNLTFANALRSFLRQDPDTIMVGEIRDTDTAELAVRAALTGHMVFSTIHANDAPSTAVRLLSMGAEPFQAASALTLVAAQRLVRRNCIHCLEDYSPPEDLLLLVQNTLEEESLANHSFKRGKGCAECKGRGYRGRIAIIEMMRMTTDLRQMVAQNQPADELRKAATESGMRTLRRSGFEKALDGVTTVEEVLRVCLADA